MQCKCKKHATLIINFYKKFRPNDVPYIIFLQYKMRYHTSEGCCTYTKHFKKNPYIMICPTVHRKELEI